MSRGLCDVIDGRAERRCADLGVLTALAADHVCIPDHLRQLTDRPAILGPIIEVADKTQQRLGDASNDEEHIMVWEHSNVKFERVDPGFGTRAAGTKAHFLLPRKNNDFDSYFRTAIDAETEANALGLYVTYHVAALLYAAASTNKAHSAQVRTDFKQRAIWNEAFALHFLQDAFSAGHVVGNWGGAAWAKGTHDYYSQHGVYAFDWNGDGHRAFGDSFLTPDDVSQSAAAAGASLAQLAAVARGEHNTLRDLRAVPPGDAHRYEAVAVCGPSNMPNGTMTKELAALVAPIARLTPRPSLGPKDVHLPRFRMELGPYIGVDAGTHGGIGFDGYDSPLPASPRGYGGVHFALRVGMGLEGITSAALDGQMFFEYGAVIETTQVDGSCGDTCPPRTRKSTALPRVPSREGMAFRARMPFFLLPGDMIVLSPILYFASFDALTSAALTAAGGGIVPWQRRLITAIGDIQFVVGREVGVHVFGWPGEGETYVRDAPGGAFTAVEATTVRLDLPVLEYRPYRDFQSRITSALLFQLGGAIDFTDEALDESYMIYLRSAFDFRLYIGSGQEE